jgi:glutaminyl-peptide cyclotransferase
VFALAVIGGCGDEEGDGAGLFDADRAYRDVEAQVEIGPRPAGSPGGREEVALIERELRAAGVEGVGVQHPHANVVGTIPGSEPGAVVVGAHHDTKNAISPDFVGANDGASGVAVVLELARSLEAPLDGPSIHLTLFDAEEARGARPFEVDGTRGSEQYVRYARAGGKQGSPPLDEIEAMVLFDLVGDCDLQIPLEPNSDPGLYELFAEGAEEASGDLAPFQGETTPIGDDHIPFREADIPAVDLIDFTFGSTGPPPGPYWHTPEDTLDKVCADSLDAVGEAAARALPRIGR